MTASDARPIWEILRELGMALERVGDLVYTLALRAEAEGILPGAQVVELRDGRGEAEGILPGAQVVELRDGRGEAESGDG